MALAKLSDKRIIFSHLSNVLDPGAGGLQQRQQRAAGADTAECQQRGLVTRRLQCWVTR